MSPLTENRFRPINRPVPKRALLLDMRELDAIDIALSDFAIEAWGGCAGVPGFVLARQKIKEALAACRTEYEQPRR